jgi:hypothetical protein
MSDPLSKEEVERGAPYGITKEEWQSVNKSWAYIAKAKELGIDVSNSSHVRQLLGAIKYCTLKYQPGKRQTEAQLAEAVGVSVEALSDWRQKGYIGVASQIVLARILSDESVLDVRHQIMSILQAGFPPLLENLMRIGASAPDGTGRSVLDRDAVQAGNVLMQSPIATAYLQLVFAGRLDSDSSDEVLENTARILGEPKPLRLDTPLEGEIISYSSPLESKSTEPALIQGSESKVEDSVPPLP